eukprot:897527-Amphidinium_carterae.1
MACCYMAIPAFLDIVNLPWSRCVTRQGKATYMHNLTGNLRTWNQLEQVLRMFAIIVYTDGPFPTVASALKHIPLTLITRVFVQKLFKVGGCVSAYNVHPSRCVSYDVLSCVTNSRSLDGRMPVKASTFSHFDLWALTAVMNQLGSSRHAKNNPRFDYEWLGWDLHDTFGEISNQAVSSAFRLSDLAQFLFGLHSRNY